MGLKFLEKNKKGTVPKFALNGPNWASLRIWELSLIFLLLFAVWERITHAYLEDDLLWFLPFIEQIFEQKGFLGFLKDLHMPQGELTFADGMYFFTLLALFGYNFKAYVLVSIGLHTINAILFYSLLKKRFSLSDQVSLAASLIFFTFYGHFHAYTWPMAAHHLWVVFFFFVITNCYLKTEELITQNKPFRFHYILTLVFAVVASFQRLSILMIPLTLAVHLFFTAKDRHELFVKYKRWVPLFFIFLFYPLIVAGFQGHGDILEGFLEPIDSIFGSSRHPLGIFTGVFLFCTLGLGFMGLYLRWLGRKSSGNPFAPWIYRGSFLIFLFSQILSLCLLFFLWPIPSAFFDDTLMRSHQFELPLKDYSSLAILPLTLILMGFLLKKIKTNQSLIIFIPWYLASSYFLQHHSYLAFRYFVYITPVLSLLLALLLMEGLPKLFPQRIQASYGRIMLALIVALCVVNLFCIKVRSIRTLLVDYHWSYDYIKTANLIRDDLKDKGISPSTFQGSVCVNGVTDIPFVEGWQEGFLNEFRSQEYRPFKQTLASVLSNRARIFVNESCPDGGQKYSIKNLAILDADGQNIETKPFVFDFVTSSVLFRGPLRDILLPSIYHSLYKLYAHDYVMDSKMNKIDSILADELKHIKLIQKNPWAIVETYKGFNIIHLKEFYFGVHSREGPFHLSKFKAGTYKHAFVAKTKRDVRKNIDLLLPEQKSVQKKLPAPPYTINFSQLEQPLTYKIFVGPIPFGKLQITLSENEAATDTQLKTYFELIPPALLRIVSGNNVGFHMTAFMDSQTLLPYRYEQIDVYLKKRGETPRTIVYDHENLFMVRKSTEEDIWENTHDLVSLFVWMMTQDYKTGETVSSTLNVDRQMYLVEGSPTNGADKVAVTFTISHVNPRLEKLDSFPLTVTFAKDGDLFVPLQINLTRNFLFIHLKKI